MWAPWSIPNSNLIYAIAALGLFGGSRDEFTLLDIESFGERTA